MTVEEEKELNRLLKAYNDNKNKSTTQTTGSNPSVSGDMFNSATDTSGEISDEELQYATGLSYNYNQDNQESFGEGPSDYDENGNYKKEKKKEETPTLSGTDENAMAGALGSVVTSLNPGVEAEGKAESVHTYSADVGSISYNSLEGGTAGYDFSAEMSNKEGKRANADMQQEEEIKEGVEALPVIGGWSTLGRATHGLANTALESMGASDRVIDHVGFLFDPLGGSITDVKKAQYSMTDEETAIEKAKEYENLASVEQEAKDQAKYASLFAKGGYLDLFPSEEQEYGDVDSLGEEQSEGVDIEKIEAGQKHEDDPMQGIRVGDNAIAEKGEVKVKLKRGDFIFSNRL